MKKSGITERFFKRFKSVMNRRVDEEMMMKLKTENELIVRGFTVPFTRGGGRVL